MVDYFCVERADALNGGKGCIKHNDPACLCDVDLTGHEPVEIRYLPDEFVNVETADDLVEAAAQLLARRDFQESTSKAKVAEITPELAVALWDQHWRGTMTQAEFGLAYGKDSNAIGRMCAYLGLTWVAKDNQFKTLWKQERAFYIFMRESGSTPGEAMAAVKERYPAAEALHKSTFSTWWMRYVRSVCGEAA